jgi:hypothetical protein
VAGQQNDIRVATNLALLGTAFELFAEYLGDVWEGWRDAARKFVEEGLVAVRDGMLGEAKEQQASEVFLRTLAELVEHNHVRIDGLPGHRDADNKPLVGRVVGARAVPGVALIAGPNQDRLAISHKRLRAFSGMCRSQSGCRAAALSQRGRPAPVARA